MISLNYRDILKREFEKRMQKNARYSLRSFARDLGISACKLSETLNEKQGLSKAKAYEIIKRLSLSKSEEELFILSVEAMHARRKIDRLNANAKLKKQDTLNNKEISAEYFTVIEKWYHFAILELMTLKDFQSDNNWIAKKLDLSISEVKIAISRLIKLGLVKKHNNTLYKVDNFVYTQTDIPSLSIKKYHEQILNQASKALYSQPLDQRDFSSINFKINNEDIPIIKEKIKDFRRSLIAEFSTEDADVLYSLSTQLLRLDRDIEL